MQSIGVRELRQDASSYLARVEAGESFQITSRGRPVAILGPTDPVDDARSRLIADGRLLPAPQPWVVPKRATVSWRSEDLIDELRDE